MSELQTLWKVKKYDRQVAAELAEDLSIPIPVANILAGRDLKNKEEVEKFTRIGIKYLHSPFKLPDIDPVLARLNKALDLSLIHI